MAPYHAQVAIQRWSLRRVALTVWVLFVALFLAMAMTDTAEYQDDLLPGDGKAVVDKLAEVG